MSGHPALKNFSPAWESIKIVGSKALKWAAYGAAAVGVAALALPVAFGLPGIAVGGVAALVAEGFGALVPAAVTALQYGATAGAVIGAVSGVGSLSEELEQRKQDRIADYEQLQLTKERGRLMALRGMGAPGGGIAPNIGFGQGQQQGMAMG